MKLRIVDIDNIRKVISDKPKNPAGHYTSSYRRAKNKLRILERDNFRCVSCGNDKNLTVDHVRGSHKMNISQYNNYHPSTCQTLCVKCHNRKNNHKNKVYPMICEDCLSIPRLCFIGQKCCVCGSRMRRISRRND